MAQKTRHEQQIVPKQPHWPRFFWGQWFAKVWAQNGLIKKRAKRRWAKSCVGQKWCGPKEWSEKPKNMEKTNKKNPLPFTQNKKSPKSKNGKNLSLPDQKNQKNQQQNQKIEKKHAQRKKIKSKEECFFFLVIHFYLFLILGIFCDVLGFWSTKNFCFPKKRICIPKKAFCVPQKVSLSPKKCVSPKKFIVSKKSFCISPKIFCIPKSFLYPRKFLVSQ